MTYTEFIGRIKTDIPFYYLKGSLHCVVVFEDLYVYLNYHGHFMCLTIDGFIITSSHNTYYEVTEMINNPDKDISDKGIDMKIPNIHALLMAEIRKNKITELISEWNENENDKAD